MSRSPTTAKRRVILGRRCRIHRAAELGCVTGRPVEIVALRIGDDAQVRSGTVIYTNTTIGHRFETGHNVVIREENTIGDDVSIWSNSTVDYGCTIGHGVRIHTNVYVAQFTTIEDEVFLAPGVATANDPHPICTKCMKGPTLKRRCRIGVNATILSHITIGEGALVGAGSVVTRDVPPGAVVFGNPAEIRKHVDELTCPFDLIVPYIDGLDVLTREKRDRVAP